MTTIANIVERFAMPIEGPPPGRDSWFLDYVLRSPKHAGKHLTAGWLALSSLKDVYEDGDIDTVWEPFGGMGAQALMVRELFNPSEHVVGEYSPEAVEHLERVLPADVEVRHADAYAWGATVGADLIVTDFGDLTAWKTREGERHRELLDSIFATDPKAVVFTDIACRYLHLHRERYESLLGPGTCASYPQYLQALLARLEALYGYRLVRGYRDRWSTVMALVPDDVDAPRPMLLETPDSPIGLELL